MDYLLELGTEELPAKKIRDFCSNIKNSFFEKLYAKQVKDFSIETLFTPRRIAFCFRGLPDKTEASEKIVKGPPIVSSERSIEGFCKKYTLSRKQLQQDLESQRFFFREKIKPLKTKELIKEAVLEIFTDTASLKSEKWMAWGSGDFKFIRPVRWILSLWEKEVLELELFGLKAGNRTRRARKFQSLESSTEDFFNWLKIDQAGSYQEIIREQGLVEVSPETRKKTILEEFHKIEKKENIYVDLDEDLLAEVVNLVESPSVLMGEFSEEFLKLPDFLIKTVLSVHQRAFACYDSESFALKNKFLVIADCLEKSKENIILGNQRVVQARLKDAEFFIKEDLKEDLEEKTKKLDQITFQEELPELEGTLASKIQRLIRISQTTLFEKNLLFDKKDLLALEKTISLSKSDLLTNSVFEFTELQGLIGGFIAEKQNYSTEICIGIKEHYLPVFLGDQVPSNKFGLVTSLIDKLDNLVALFYLGKIPTGSADPFALRRQAQGVIEILLSEEFIKITKDQNFSLKSLVLLVVEEYQKAFKNQTNQEKRENLSDKLLSFFKQRLDFVLSSRFSTSLVQVFSSKAIFEKDLSFLQEDLRFLKTLDQKELYFETFQQIRRISRILRNRESNLTDFKDLSLSLTLPEEKELYQQVQEYKNNQGTSKWERLANLKNPIIRFFDQVLVEDKKNPSNSKKRKELLAELLNLVNQDFSYPNWDVLVELFSPNYKS